MRAFILNYRTWEPGFNISAGTKNDVKLCDLWHFFNRESFFDIVNQFNSWYTFCIKYLWLGGIIGMTEDEQKALRALLREEVNAAVYASEQRLGGQLGRLDQ